MLAFLACTVGCGFQSPAGIGRDAGIDMAIDMAPDGDSSMRTRTGLIGLWEFDETGGMTVHDTSDLTAKVALTVGPGTVTFSSSMMTPDGLAVITSSNMPHLDTDVNAAHAVTLEAWVMPSAADQGSLAAPRVIAGLCSKGPTRRNISLLQAGRRWVARVRTALDPAGRFDDNGKPDLISSVDITPGAMTHLVVVADATQRILYVDGRADATDALPGAPSGWDASYKMALGNELSMDRQWAGTFALVAMYNRALSKELVGMNFHAGANAR